MKTHTFILPVIVLFILSGCVSSKSSILSNKYHEDKIGKVFIYSSSGKNDKYTGKLALAIQLKLQSEGIEVMVYEKNYLDLATDADIMRMINESGASHRLDIKMNDDIVFDSGGLGQTHMMIYTIDLHNLFRSQWTWSGILSTNVRMLGGGQIDKAASVVIDQLKTEGIL